MRNLDPDFTAEETEQRRDVHHVKRGKPLAVLQRRGPGIGSPFQGLVPVTGRIIPRALPWAGLNDPFGVVECVPGSVSYTHLDVYKRQPWERHEPGGANRIRATGCVQQASKRSLL